MKQLIFIICSLLMAATSAVAQDNYRIEPGDTIAVEVLEDPQLNRSVLVLPDGTINFPFAGSIAAGGKTPGEVEAAIRNGISSNFSTTPTVFVTVSALRPIEPTIPSTFSPEPDEQINIYLVGEVNTPGILPVLKGTTFLQAVAQSGGFSRFAAKKRVQLRRHDAKTGKKSVFTMNFKALSDGARLQNDVVLQEGDVILVPERRLFE